VSRRGKGGPRRLASGDVATNRQARFRYELLDKWEAGIVLQGSEVKSLRDGKANLKDSYALVRDGELWLIGCHIAPYAPAAGEGHDPERPRKLLLHRKEIERLIGKTAERGLALIPLRVYFAHGLAKVELGLARGRRQFEKRQAIAEREHRREIEREVGRRR
jgi:SsrA-binding protein